MYLPKSKYRVVTVKPGEYQLAGKVYVGSAIILSDGTAYAGNSIAEAKDLLQRTNLQEFPSREIYRAVPIKREPVEEEYTAGYMVRYFCQDLRTMKVFEISKENYTKLVENVELQNIYRVRAVDWRLTGPVAEIHNKDVISDLDKELPGIESSEVLNNPLQFFRKDS